MSEETIDQQTIVNEIYEKSLAKNSEDVYTFSERPSSDRLVLHDIVLEGESQVYNPYKQFETNYTNEDNRTRITGDQIKQFPYCCIGLITAHLNGKQIYATGVLIEPRVVLTCAQSLYDVNYAEMIRFFPAFDGKNFSRLRGVDLISIPDQYIETKDENYNYALLLLDKPLEEYGCMGISYLDSRQTNDYFNLYGYPQDKVNGKADVHELWGSKQRINFDQDNLLTDKFYPTPGQEGSPVFSILPGTNNCVLYGIFTSPNVKFVRNMSSIVKDLNELLGKNIQFLNAYDAEINDEGFKLLLQKNIQFENLHGFSLNCQNISFETFTLIKNVNLTNLRWLTLNNNHYGDEGFQFLSDCGFLKNLRILTLNKELTSKSLELLSSIELPELQDLTIRPTFPTDAWKNFSKINLPSLNKLYINSVNLTDDDLQYIAGAKLNNLVELDLSYNQITGTGLSHFIGKSLDNLKRLDLSQNPITDTGLLNLSQLSLPQLRVLELMNTKDKTKAGVENLLNMNFPILEYIELYPHNEISGFLKEKFTNLTVSAEQS